MKKIAAGLLTALCATAFSFAQPIDQPAAQPHEQEAPQTAPTTTEAKTLASPQATPATQQAPAASQAASPKQKNFNTTNANDTAPIDEQPVAYPQKKNPVSIGAKAAFIYGNLWGFEGLKDDDLEDPSGFGGEFGITARFVIVDGLHFVPEISFRIFDVSHEDEGFTRYYNQMFLDFAFLMRGFIGNSVFLEAGPQLSINTSSDVKINEDGGFKENIEQAPVEFGLNIGIGYFVAKRFSIGFRWYMGFNEVFPDVKYYFDEKFNPSKDRSSKWSLINLKGAHTMMFKFGINYWFI